MLKLIFVLFLCYRVHFHLSWKRGTNRRRREIQVIFNHFTQIFFDFPINISVSRTHRLSVLSVIHLFHRVRFFRVPPARDGYCPLKKIIVLPVRVFPVGLWNIAQQQLYRVFFIKLHVLYSGFLSTAFCVIHASVDPTEYFVRKTKEKILCFALVTHTHTQYCCCSVCVCVCMRSRVVRNR